MAKYRSSRELNFNETRLIELFVRIFSFNWNSESVGYV